MLLFISYHIELIIRVGYWNNCTEPSASIKTAIGSDRNKKYFLRNIFFYAKKDFCSSQFKTFANMSLFSELQMTQILGFFIRFLPTEKLQN